MKIRLTLYTIIFSLFSVSILYSQKWSLEEREIRKLQDQRSLGEGKIFEYATNQNAGIRFRCAIALANIQSRDSTSFRVLTYLLRDPSIKVRAAAAFAFGQIGFSQGYVPLLRGLSYEPDFSVRARIVEALGKTGPPFTLDSLLYYSTKRENEKIHSDFSLAIANFALRGIKSENSIEFCFGLLKRNDSRTQWAALYALMRSAPDSIIDSKFLHNAGLIDSLIGRGTIDVKIQIFQILGLSKTDLSVELMKKYAETDISANNWRVIVQIARSTALLMPKYRELSLILEKLLQSENNHIIIASLQGLNTLQREVIQSFANLETIHSQLKNICENEKFSVVSKGEAFISLMKFFNNLEMPIKVISQSGASSILKAKCIEAVSQIPDTMSLSFLLHHLTDSDKRVSTASWDFIRTLFSPTSKAKFSKEFQLFDSIPTLLTEKAQKSLIRRDIAITTAVANTFRDTAVFNMLRGTMYAKKVIESLVSTYMQLNGDDDAEARQEIIITLGVFGDTSVVTFLEKAISDPSQTVTLKAVEALHRLTGKDYSTRLKFITLPSYKDYDWEFIDSIPTQQRVSISTERGKIIIELMKDNAPFTVLSFIRLINKEFYNNLTFHRVVPNFVIQGGDPRGDGFGGPGYSIRSEFSLVSFDRGMVGMASAGKDTEGCQFFIMHSPAPRLDGRYTLFGRVVEGIEIVDEIQVGDRIISISLD